MQSLCLDLDTAWNDFQQNNYTETNIVHKKNNKDIIKNNINCSELYISTKTKISYLNSTIDLYNVFWKIPIINYYSQMEGVVKKEMKFNSVTKSELNNIIDNINSNDIYTQQFIINSIDNPNGRIKFKDTRKISVGLCQKDLLTYRCKKKSAFYNCFVVIMRVKLPGKKNFKEMHVKVFNTGKLEIPGIQNDNDLHHILSLLIKILKPLQVFEKELKYMMEQTETVLINSNFNCGYYINREKLYNILKFDYKINSNYDPCSYPGIQCSFYYVKNRKIQNGQQPNYDMKKINNHTKISFMIFRTGRILIVGKCTEKILYSAYNFIKNILIDQFDHIYVSVNNNVKKTKEKKPKKKIIYVKK